VFERERDREREREVRTQEGEASKEDGGGGTEDYVQKGNPCPDRRPKKKTERMKEGDGKGDGRLRDLSEDVRASRLRMRAI